MDPMRMQKRPAMKFALWNPRATRKIQYDRALTALKVLMAINHSSFHTNNAIHG